LPTKETIMEGEKEIAQLDRKHYVALPIAPGHHVLRLKHKYWSRPGKVELDVLPGETYYLVADNHPVPELTTCYRTFSKVTKDEAEALMSKMKPQPGE
jgi:hypothetical protein